MRENPELFRPENTKNYKFSQASTSSLLQALKAEHTKVNQNQDTNEMASESKLMLKAILKTYLTALMNIYLLPRKMKRFVPTENR